MDRWVCHASNRVERSPGSPRESGNWTTSISLVRSAGAIRLYSPRASTARGLRGSRRTFARNATWCSSDPPACRAVHARRASGPRAAWELRAQGPSRCERRPLGADFDESWSHRHGATRHISVWHAQLSMATATPPCTRNPRLFRMRISRRCRFSERYPDRALHRNAFPRYDEQICL